MKVKEIIYLLVIVAVIMLVIKRCCRDGYVSKPGDLDTLSVKVDTFYIEVKTIDTVYQPRLVKTTEYIPVFKTDTIIQTEKLVFDTAKLIKDYFAVREYSDTQKIQYGQVVINDRVRANKIFSRNLVVDQKIPEITKTVVAIERQKKKRWGIGIQSGYQINGRAYLGVGISYSIIQW